MNFSHSHYSGLEIRGRGGRKMIVPKQKVVFMSAVTGAAHVELYEHKF
jgi:hypothetical protein